VRRVDAGGNISTVAGGGQPPDEFGEGLPATDAQLAFPEDVTTDIEGNLYIADTGHNRIRKVILSLPPPPKMGDVNGDGQLNVSDILLVIRAGAKLDTLTTDQAKRADVNGDGVVNVLDALRILRVLVKLDPPFA
jgi:hypothetical protein